MPNFPNDCAFTQQSLGPCRLPSGQTAESIRNAALDDVIHLICRSVDLKIGADVGPELLRRIEKLRPASDSTTVDERKWPPQNEPAASPPTLQSSAQWYGPVRELLGHISDALDNSAFDKIDRNRWNAVSALVGSTEIVALAAPPAEGQEPAAPRQR